MRTLKINKKEYKVLRAFIDDGYIFDMYSDKPRTEENISDYIGWIEVNPREFDIHSYFTLLQKLKKLEETHKEMK